MDAKAHLLQLRREFLLEFPQQLNDLRGILVLSPADAYRRAHALAGMSGMHGFGEVSRAARALLDLGEPDGQGFASRPADALRALDALAAVVEAAANPRPAEAEDQRRVYVLPAPGEAAAGLEAPLRLYGYDVRILRTFDELQAAVREALPSAVLADLDAVPPDPGASLRGIPLVFLSDRGDVPSRLRAVRAGGRAYLLRPVDPAALVDRLDAVSGRRTSDPYRVLIVDDDMDVARHSAVVLTAAGIRTAVVTDPLAVQAELEEFAPDLILMDLHMPACSGIELAATIRQQEAYVGTPIVFLSSEQDVERQLAAQRSGGDDFLSKPIDPARLAAEVATRAERARALQKVMVRDGLTGLLNHATFSAQLELEVARAKRTGLPLSFAMIDVDHFKLVNDVHGHGGGDRVLRALARVLTKRLRQTDLVGRLGGEEFALALPGCPGPAARTVLEDLRRRFGELLHRSDAGDFRVTFSAGLASSPPVVDAASLREAADRALYRAKGEGRNRVVSSQ